VVETNSVSAAARRLGLAKSVISKRVSDLESAIGGELLHRSSRKVVPTDRGDVFYRRARDFLQQLEDAIEEAGECEDELRGHLRLATPMSFGTQHLVSLLAPLFARHPRLSVSLDLDDRKVDLSGGGFDLGIRIGRLADSALAARRLAISRRVVVCSPAYAQAHGLPASPEALHAHECISYANTPALQQWTFQPNQEGGAPRQVLVKGRIVANNGEAIREAAIAGLGLAVLPTFIAGDALRDGRLINAMPHERPSADGVYAVYPKTRLPSRKVRAVIDHLVEAIGDAPPWDRGLSLEAPERI